MNPRYEIMKNRREQKRLNKNGSKSEESDIEILKSDSPEWSWRHPIRSIIINRLWMDARISAIERDEVRAYILLIKTRME